MCEHPVEKEQEIDEETKQALEQLAKITAEGIAAIFREDSIRRTIQRSARSKPRSLTLYKKEPKRRSCSEGAFSCSYSKTTHRPQRSSHHDI